MTFKILNKEEKPLKYRVTRRVGSGKINDIRLELLKPFRYIITQKGDIYHAKIINKDLIDRDITGVGLSEGDALIALDESINLHFKDFAMTDDKYLEGGERSKDQDWIGFKRTLLKYVRK